MAFAVFTPDVDPHRGLQFGDQDEFWFEGPALVVRSHLGVRYYAPRQWQEVH
ncbi:hypothetical protein [Nocardia niigatensis]|uniref:hypothetical protein n=1 Tax=Nocardia niigatensis TaxID=209249 RepID=UPI0012F63338|nr:hypothetical protein [Nocardia niigatensis]